MVKTFVSVALVMFLLAGSAAAAELSYADRVSGTVTYLDITATEGTDTIWTMTINLGRADGHQYWTKGEIASFKDVCWGGTAFDYSPESGTVASVGMYSGAAFTGTFAEGTRGTGSYTFTYSGTITDGGGDTADYTYTTTIFAPTSVTAVGGGKYTYESVLQTDILFQHTSGGSVDLDGTQNSSSLALNNGGYTGWTILNPIVAGQDYPVVHANDSSDGNQLYSLIDWYGDLGGNHNDGFLVDFTVKNNGDTTGLNMRPGLNFELINDDISLNYCDRSNNNIGKTENADSGSAAYNDVHGYLSNAREAYNDGADLPVDGSWSGTSTLTITAPIPEPHTMGLLGLGVFGLVMRRKRSK